MVYIAIYIIYKILTIIIHDVTWKEKARFVAPQCVWIWLKQSIRWKEWKYFVLYCAKEVLHYNYIVCKLKISEDFLLEEVNSCYVDLMRVVAQKILQEWKSLSEIRDVNNSVMHHGVAGYEKKSFCWICNIFNGTTKWRKRKWMSVYVCMIYLLGILIAN